MADYGFEPWQTPGNPGFRPAQGLGGAAGGGAAGGQQPPGWTNYFGNLTPFQQLYYGQNPDQAYAIARQQLAPMSTSPWASYINSRYGDLQSNFAQQSLSNPQLQWTDYLNQHLGGLRQQFQSLGQLDRGFSLFNLDSGTGGRYVG